MSDIHFHHEALLYSGNDGFVAGTLPFIRDGLRAAEPVLVAVARPRIDALKQALGADAERVYFTDMHVLGRNPARIIPAWSDFLSQRARDGNPVRAIGEPVWPGRTRAELSECRRHESLLNCAFDGRQTWSLLCPYDVDGLDEEAIEVAYRTHPLVSRDGAALHSQQYVHPDASPGPFAGGLTPFGEGTTELRFCGEQLGLLRRRLSSWALEFGLEARCNEQLVLAVNELASNSVRYGGGSGTVRMYRDQETLLVEILDAGRITAPLAGRVRPAPQQPAGRGLWLVNQLCDLVQIRSGESGTVVRLHMHLN